MVRLSLSLLLLGLCLAAGFEFGGWGKLKFQSSPIRYVKVEGAFQYISKEGLKQVLTPYVEKGYYHADMPAIQRALQAMPLVLRADVKRVWPDSVYIKIIEYKPVVRWGDRAVLTKQGEILYPENMAAFQHLPLITGPEGQERKWLEVMKGVYLELRDKSLQLAEFHVNERQAWRIRLANGLEMELGSRSPLQNMHRFLNTLELLGGGQLALMERVDTRYPNGYAVTWRPGMADTAWQSLMEKIKY